MDKNANAIQISSFVDNFSNEWKGWLNQLIQDEKRYCVNQKNFTTFVYNIVPFLTKKLWGRHEIGREAGLEG